MPSSTNSGPSHLTPALATVLRDMLFQARDRHRHSNRLLPLFGGLQIPEPHQPPHPVARLDELAFEPSMFRTTYRQARSRTHLAPVENRERQSNIMANRKQTLFFALYSPISAQGALDFNR